MGNRILVIDDSNAIRESLAFILQEEGFEVIESADGNNALEKLNGQEINLIICDVNMPNMDGIEFLKKLRNDDKYSSYKFIAIIMLTTESVDAKKEEGIKAGAKAWIVKPFKPEELIKAVNKLIV